MEKRLQAVIKNMQDHGRAYYGRDLQQVVEVEARKRSWHFWHDCTASWGMLAKKQSMLRWDK